jgi:hypothetical protein
MAGGVWLAQNKIRPGCYINFKAVKQPNMTVGDRGIVALPLNLSWGNDTNLISVLSTDLLNGDSLKLVGMTAFDSESKLLASALSYCYKALVYRIPTTGATKATANIGSLTATAKYTGSFGNKLTIMVTQDEVSQLYTVSTLVAGEEKDKQVISDISELSNNDYVVFTGVVDQVNTGVPLVDGTDGEAESESSWYPKYLNMLEKNKWQTMCCFSSDDAIKQSVCTFIENLRDTQGMYVQGVVADYSGANSEGIINSISSVEINGDIFSKEDFVAVVAGMTAGSNITQSNTAKEIIGASRIVNDMTNTEIEEALKNGKFLISYSRSGKIKVEQDINSLHTYGQDRSYTFSKNRCIRTLDEIGTTTKGTWEDQFMGKFDNNSTGLDIFRSVLIKYAQDLQNMSAIRDFSAGDITVAMGNDVDSVVAEFYVRPVDSMEKLYFTVNVE